MKDFFIDLFEYHHYFNQALTDLLEENKAKLGDTIVPLFSHCLNAHHIWNTRIMGGEPYGVHEIHSLEICKELDRSNFENSLKILAGHDLKVVVTYKNSKGEAYQNSVQEILFQVINHHTHHKAQIMTRLRHNGIEPLVTDYIFYKR